MGLETVYRVISERDAASLKTKGFIEAKDPTSNRKVVQHVNGTLPTKYISTTADLQSAINFAGLAREYNKKKNKPLETCTIVKIDLVKMKAMQPGNEIIDLTDPKVLDRELPPPPPGKEKKGKGYGAARIYATQYKEVLIVGKIPKDCVEKVSYNIKSARYSEDDYSGEDDVSAFATKELGKALGDIK